MISVVLIRLKKVIELVLGVLSFIKVHANRKAVKERCRPMKGGVISVGIIYDFSKVDTHVEN